MKPRDKSLKGTAPPSPMLSAASTVVNSSLGPWEHRTARCRWKSKRGRSRLHHTRATPSSAALFTYGRPTKPDTVTALPASAAVSSASSAALLALGTSARGSGCNVTAQQPRPPHERCPATAGHSKSSPVMSICNVIRGPRRPYSCSTRTARLCKRPSVISTHTKSTTHRMNLFATRWIMEDNPLRPTAMDGSYFSQPCSRG